MDWKIREDRRSGLASTGRRKFMQKMAAGTLVVALGGGLYVCDDDLTRKAQAETRKDGRPRLPPGQHVIRELRPMGGEAGDPRPKDFKLVVHGEVEHPFEIDYRKLVALGTTIITADVHCVTKWSVLGNTWQGVRVAELAKMAGLKPTAHHVIFEAAHGYTSNVLLHEALAPNVMVTYRMNGHPFSHEHGAPVRALVPDLYFWKSAKWLTGIRFSEHDHPGYWERRGYNNHADPWREERYA